ncbi:unnamed protein product [Ciceribacter selenitireducens ATCC BAA-1503]|uniref:Uncharacterized protein n=1 Tax=Ciceribacter selenitireducens ATCC BAA-1503 TaxID=1336235 RepID=A0A376AA16_9HYPH|nr:unnamed protein product [Ciceribacter selenitireducens ATCC BAA-1503]
MGTGRHDQAPCSCEHVAGGYRYLKHAKKDASSILSFYFADWAP